MRFNVGLVIFSPGMEPTTTTTTDDFSVQRVEEQVMTGVRLRHSMQWLRRIRVQKLTGKTYGPWSISFNNLPPVELPVDVDDYTFQGWGVPLTSMEYTRVKVWGVLAVHQYGVNWTNGDDSDFDFTGFMVAGVAFTVDGGRVV